ncbi:NAD kinase [Odoribacter sp. OttesenSCG-928-J03]|nr:NAD kinase [Odoribacter sp. OttesenSCG-928-J03]MDL2283461.1 NAD kinase [Odoribacter sp. OttesenSCG-928-G04]
MRTVAFFGKSLDEDFLPYMKKILHGLKERGMVMKCETGFADLLASDAGIDCSHFFDGVFDMESVECEKIDLLLSIGGDGTFLHSIHYVKKSGVPILGVNTGRLGFLAHFSVSEIDVVLDYIVKGDYSIEERDVLCVKVKGGNLKGFNYVLNEISIQKTETSSLLRIHASIGDEYLTTYWADGLIVASPTGSTAYSLSAGGPIIAPGCKNILLTPLCPHNLNMRALVVPSDTTIKLDVESRSDFYTLTMDSGVEVMHESCSLEIFTGDFKINMVKLPGNNFYKTLREKLSWGADKRNK